jgi:MFS family permease
VSDALGRKSAIALACVIFVIGAVTMTLAQNFEVMLLGRIVTGLGVGCGFVVSPVYITEITPPEIRGRLVSLTDVCINVGILLGYITAFGKDRAACMSFGVLQCTACSVCS